MQRLNHKFLFYVRFSRFRSNAIYFRDIQKQFNLLDAPGKRGQTILLSLLSILNR